MNTMKIFQKKMITLVACLFAYFGATISASAVDIDRSNYRIAMSFDGHGDLDDICATAFAIALVGEAGLKDKLVHVDYFNHLPRSNNTPAFQSREVKKSVKGALRKWGMRRGLSYDDRTQLNQALANFKNKAKSGSRIYYACGGPMEVPWRAINQLTDARRSKITCISHSEWNNNAGAHTFADLARLGAKTVGISDQNKNAFAGKRGSQSNYQWLKNRGGKYTWLYNRNKIDWRWDASDAGMTFYIITGRGIQNATISQIRSVFE